MKRKSEVYAIVYCLGCGCTEFNPCETDDGPCSWVALDSNTQTGWCSACNDQLGIKRLEKLRRTVNTLIERLSTTPPPART